MEKGNCYGQQSVPTSHSLTLTHPLPLRKNQSLSSSHLLTWKMQRAYVICISAQILFLVWPIFSPICKYQQYHIIRNSSVFFLPGLQIARHQLGIRILEKRNKKSRRTMKKSWAHCLQNEEVCFDQLQYA